MTFYSSFPHTNDKKHCSEIRNYHQNGHFTRRIIVLGLGITLKTGLKCYLTATFFQKNIFAYKLPDKLAAAK